MHHLIPRPEGTDDPDNLMLLCHGCHDLADEYGRGTRRQIVKYIQDEIARLDPVVVRKNKLGTDWHHWVYGGRRNPQLDIK